MATVTNPGSFMATITHPTGNGIFLRYINSLLYTRMNVFRVYGYRMATFSV